MRFRFSFFGVEILDIEFALPSKGLYPVPDYIDPDLYELSETLINRDTAFDIEDEDEE